MSLTETTYFCSCVQLEAGESDESKPWALDHPFIGLASALNIGFSKCHYWVILVLFLELYRLVFDRQAVLRRRNLRALQNSNNHVRKKLVRGEGFIVCLFHGREIGFFRFYSLHFFCWSKHWIDECVMKCYYMTLALCMMLDKLIILELGLLLDNVLL